MRFPLQVLSYENSRVSTGDRFAAQIVYATGRCPPMYRLVTDCRSFHLQFTVYECDLHQGRFAIG